MPNKPDFVVAGFPRCGTTWLYEVLRLHPKIFLPARKEIAFFDAAYDKGYPWYAAYFAGCAADQQAGDISPVYAEHPAVPERIRATLPDAKIILILRSHLARTRSSYRHFQRDGRTDGDDYRDLDAFLAGRAERSPYLERQRYAPVLEAYLKRFGRERVLILLHEDLGADPRAFVERILAFLGLAEVPWPEAMLAKLHEQVNPTFAPRHPRLYRAAQRLNQRLRGTHLRLLDRPMAAGKQLFLGLIGGRPRAELGAIPGEDRLRRFFAEDVQAVETIIGRPVRQLWV